MTGLANLTSPDVAILLSGAVLGGVVQGISGFAFGMVAMSIWAWGIDPLLATVLAVFGGLCGQLVSAISIRREGRSSDLLPFLIGGFVGVPIGTHLLPSIDAAAFKVLLGIILVLGCPLMMAAPRMNLAVAAGRIGDGVAGLVGGIIGGISGLTGVAPAIWGAVRGFDKARQRELLQNFNIAMLTATLIALTWRGAITTETVPYLGIVAISMLVPSIIGAKLYVRLPEASFRRVVLILLTMSGLALMASSWSPAVGVK